MDRLQAKKSLGQNFLIDKNISTKIVELIEPAGDSHVIEIGPGTGALTDILVDKKINMTAIEIDQRAYDLLKNKFKDSGNFNIINKDILELDFYDIAQEKAKKLRVIGNIPYNISAPIFFKLYESHKFIEKAVLTVQKEVAQRMIAPPGSKVYGILSVITAKVCKARIAFDIPPQCFRPIPKVMSSVLVMDFYPAEKHEVNDLRKFINFIKAAFSQRRKMLSNSLKNYVGSVGFDAGKLSPEDKSLVEGLFKKRPEQLSLVEFEKLFNIIKIFSEKKGGG